MAQVVTRSVDKFIKGQNEHGGNFLRKGLDFNAETESEILDLISYHYGNHYVTNNPS